MTFEKNVDNSNIDNLLNTYLDIVEKTDWTPFIASTSISFVKELIFLFDEDYLNRKINIIELWFLLKKLKENLEKSNKFISYNSYVIDSINIHRKYNLKTILKYDWKYKLSTYYRNWINKIKFEYGKKLNEESKEFYSDTFLENL